MEAAQQSLHLYLIQKSKEGDRRAQNELYRLYVQAMFNICRRMMGDEDEAKDVLQDAFVEIFSKLDTLKEDGVFSAWVKRIVVNHCINRIRKKKVLTEELQETHDVLDNEDDNDFWHTQNLKKVVQAIDHLPEGCKTVLNLYAFEGYDHQEIADILGVTVSASKAQYSKAKAKIRNLVLERA